MSFSKQLFGLVLAAAYVSAQAGMYQQVRVLVLRESVASSLLVQCGGTNWFVQIARALGPVD
jgi:hypothetical protein